MAKPPSVQQYAQAIDELDELHAAGQVTQGAYDVRRARLLAEASKPPRSTGETFLIWLGCIVGGLVVIYVVLYIVALVLQAAGG